MTLEALIKDGRIHPARIEELVEKSRQEMDNRIREYGEEAAYEIGAMNLHPDLIKIMGRLQFIFISLRYVFFHLKFTF